MTADGKYFIFHDDNMKNIAGVDIDIEKSNADRLEAVRMRDTDGRTLRSDLVIPTLADYISVCRKYDKVAVLELKNRMEEKHVAGIARKIDDMGWLEKTTFISFSAENLIALRGLYPNVSIQFLTGEATEENFSLMKKYRFDADLCGLCVTERIYSPPARSRTESQLLDDRPPRRRRGAHRYGSGLYHDEYSRIIGNRR